MRNNLSGSVERKISRIQAHVRSQTCVLNLCPEAITKFSKQFIPDFAKMSLSTTEQDPSPEISSCLSITLIDTPFQLAIEIINQ